MKSIFTYTLLGCLVIMGCKHNNESKLKSENPTPVASSEEGQEITNTWLEYMFDTKTSEKIFDSIKFENSNEFEGSENQKHLIARDHNSKVLLVLRCMRQHWMLGGRPGCELSHRSSDGELQETSITVDQLNQEGWNDTWQWKPDPQWQGVSITIAGPKAELYLHCTPLNADEDRCFYRVRTKAQDSARDGISGQPIARSTYSFTPEASQKVIKHVQLVNENGVKQLKAEDENGNIWAHLYCKGEDFRLGTMVAGCQFNSREFDEGPVIAVSNLDSFNWKEEWQWKQNLGQEASSIIVEGIKSRIYLGCTQEKCVYNFDAVE